MNPSDPTYKGIPVDNDSLTGLSRTEEDAIFNSLSGYRHFNEEQAWASIRQKSGLKPASQPVMRRIVLRYAAALLILVVAFLGALEMGFPKEHYLNNGLVAESFLLSDGSEVLLAPGAELSLSRFFNRNERVARFSGSGYFSIASNPEKPFHIHADQSEIKVLGTRFFVQDNPARNEISLELIEGKLEYRDKVMAAEWLLDSNETLVNRSGIIHKTRLERIPLPEWMPGYVLLDDVNLNEAVRLINDACGRRVLIVKDREDAEKCRIRTVVAPGEIDRFILELKLLFNVKIRSYKGSFTIDEINCNG